MLRVLTTQSADEPAPLAPRYDAHRLHSDTPVYPGNLALEEAPALASRPSALSGPVRVGPGLLTQGREPLDVEPVKLLETQREDEGERPFLTRGPAVLDDLLELRAQGDR